MSEAQHIFAQHEPAYAEQRPRAPHLFHSEPEPEREEELATASSAAPNTFPSAAPCAEPWQDAKERLRLFEFTVEHSNDPVLITTIELDLPGPSIVYANRAFTDMSGYTSEEVIGQTPRILQGPQTSRDEMARMRCELEAGRPFVGQTINYTKGGHLYFMEWSVYGLHDEAGALCYYVAVQRDISARKRHEMQIEEQARQLMQANEKLAHANKLLAELSLTDNLTGLFNHRALQQKMREELARSKRYCTPLSLLLLDVDHFKLYNDAFGHPEGDKTLQKIALLLRSHSRANDIVARHGGEEFAILLPQTDREGALALAEQLRLAIQDASWPQRKVTISIGVATSWPAPALNGSSNGASSHTDGGQNFDSLMRCADEALYRSKNAGRNQIA